MRGLAARPTPTVPDLDAVVGAVFERRLLAHSDRPVAVALSGGGDSLALALAAAPWTSRAARPLLVLTVDHCLRPESADWTAACAETAARLQADFKALSWRRAETPSTGLPAAARAARQRLLAEAARAGGARVILMGHTADDVHEARRMRAEGSTTPEPREWAPSPAWPEGRGVFLLRPLLGVARADIRLWLQARGERWIEDPANDDVRFARTRARRSSDETVAPVPLADASALADQAQQTAYGGLTLKRAALRAVGADAALRFVSAACLCAAGTDRPPAHHRAHRLTERLLADGAVVATLAGARIEADGRDVHLMREGGEAARGGLAPLHLGAGQSAVWDGRIEIVSDRPLEIRRLAGLTAALPRVQRTALRMIAPTVRAALPVIVEAQGSVASPLLGEVPGVRAEMLAYRRLLGACGSIQQEPA